jgi:hypothetical protein
MADSNEYKQLLDVSRSLAEVVKELKQTNKNLGAISGSVSKDLKDISKSVSKDLQGLPDKIAESTGSKKNPNLPENDAVKKGAEMLKKFGLEDFMDQYEAEISKLMASKSAKQNQQKVPVKGALKDGGKATEPGTYVVGENGPEIMEIPGGSKVVPLNVSDLIDGLNAIPRMKGFIKDGFVKVENQGGYNFLVGDNGRYPIEEIKKSIQSDIAENSALGLDTKSDSDKLTVLDSLSKKISEQGKSAASGAPTAGPFAGVKGETGRVNVKTAESIISESGGIKSMLFKDFYPSQSEVDNHVAQLIKETPGLANNSDVLNYEIEKFMDEEANRRFSEAKKKSESSVLNTESPELSKVNKGEGPAAKKEGGNKSGTDAIKSGVEMLKAFGLEDYMGQYEAEISKLMESKGIKQTDNLDKKLFSENGKVEKTTAGSAKTASGLLAKPASVPAGKKPGSKVEKSNAALSKTSKPAPAEASQTQPAPQPPAPAAAPMEAKSDSGSGGGGNTSSSSTTSKSGGEGNGSEGSPFLSNDMKEIKALLGSMARSLSGPLNIYNPDPFRPDSRRI